MQAIYKLKCFIIHREEQNKINENNLNVFYLIPHTLNIIISACNQYNK